jgi:5'-phosphate synthase pdxT subunit
MRIGVLALQGDFAAHERALRDLDAESIEVRTADDLAKSDGLILPGGESSTILKQLLEDGLADPLRIFARTKPLLGTCAGAVLMARRVTNPTQESFGFIDIEVERNAYGRQADSSIRRLAPENEFVERGGPGTVEAMFIRAPMIRAIGNDVVTLIADDGVPVFVEQGAALACTFHPELTSDRRIHQLFLEKVRKASA